MKTDARVKYTKMVLKKALLELMQHKPVNKITVKEICERAELNRATFYAHYSDCFDLLESIEEELFGQFERSMQSYTRSFDIAGLVDGLYRIVQENEAVCRVLLFGRRSTELIHRMIAYAHDLSISAWRKSLKNASADELEMLYLCLSNGLLSVVLDGYDRFDRQGVIRFVEQMYRQAITPFLTEVPPPGGKRHGRRERRHFSLKYVRFLRLVLLRAGHTSYPLQSCPILCYNP